ncbi:serine hydrolase domain-containing protein [Georgenia faecalis]|uniref:Serine hydrolase domain-containing protein n=1 Tax=Georgenia faecalis TaxID=2483799 RepID=A0ABV9D714_9MICO
MLIESLLADVVSAGIRGLTVSVRSPGQAGAHFSAGVADAETGIAMEPNSYIRISSVTKIFTATAVLQLVADGRVMLDEPAAGLLPRDVGSHVDGVTVRQLLNHTSGLLEPELLLFPSIREGSLESVVRHADRALEPERLARLALENRPMFAPGEQYWYSNTNYHLLGLIIERVTGRSAYDVIESRVLAPAGLRSTFFPRAKTALPSPSSVGYDSLYQLVDPPVAVTAYDTSFLYTAGALVSTPHDLNQFAATLLRGDLLPPEALDEMTTMIPIADGVEMGLGVQRTTQPSGTYLASEGTFFGTQTVLMATPDGSASWVISVNTTKYQQLGPDGWPLAHPADAAVAALGAYLNEHISRAARP